MKQLILWKAWRECGRNDYLWKCRGRTDTQIVQRVKEGIEGNNVVVNVEENDLRNNGGDGGRVNRENEEWVFQMNEGNYEVIAQENVREGDEENVEEVENVQDSFGGYDENV